MITALSLFWLILSVILHLWMMPICLMNILIWDVWHRLISAHLLIHRGISEKNFFKFLEAGRIHLIGSDCHNLTSRKPDFESGIHEIEKSVALI